MKVDFFDLAENWPIGTKCTVHHDGFAGTVQGYYITREGKTGLVLQQDGTRVVHVYSMKWFLPEGPDPYETRGFMSEDKK